jgi:hypothetical protein
LCAVESGYLALLVRDNPTLGVAIPSSRRNRITDLSQKGAPMQVLADVRDLPKATNIRTQLVALWIAPVSALVLLIAFLAFPGFRPPMSPGWTADEVASFYRDNTAWIRFSMVTFNLCGIMLLPFFCVVVVQMKRMANQSTAFAYCYLSAVVSGATVFALADIFFAVAAFRPERDPDLIMLLNDLGWMVFIAPVGMIVAQNLMLALAVYHDNGPNRVFPRWVGHVSLLTALAMVPSACAAVTTRGPLAWDGAVSFWLRNGSYGAFIVIMFFVVRAAVHRQALEEGVAR